MADPVPGERIAIFIPTLDGGGAERVMLNLSEGIAATGLQVDLVVADRRGAFRDRIGPGVRCIDLAAPRTFFSLPRLVHYLRTHRPVALLAAMDHANLVALAARWLSRTGTHTAVSLHTTYDAAYIRGMGRLGPWIVKAARWAYPRAQAVVAVSAGVAQDLRGVIGVPASLIHVIPNPIVFPGLAELAQAAVEHHWFADGEPPVIMAAGRLTYQKDFATLIDAVALLRGSRNLRLVIFGEGEERAALERQVAAHDLGDVIDLPGFAANPFAYMRRAAALVLSSRYEGFGNVLVEALAVGTNVVSTDCPAGPAEILEHGRYGRLVPVGDPAAMAAAIAAALDDPLDSAILRQRAETFGVSRVVPAYLRALGRGAEAQAPGRDGNGIGAVTAHG